MTAGIETLEVPKMRTGRALTVVVAVLLAVLIAATLTIVRDRTTTSSKTNPATFSADDAAARIRTTWGAVSTRFDPAAAGARILATWTS